MRVLVTLRTELSTSQVSQIEEQAMGGWQMGCGNLNKGQETYKVWVGQVAVTSALCGSLTLCNEV